MRATNPARSLAFFVSVSVIGGAGGCSLRLDFDECPGFPCADGLVCIDGGCVLPPNPSCTAPDPPIDGESIVFGAVQNLSGDQSEFSLNHQLAMRLAVEQINAAGVLGQRKLSMIWCDSRNVDSVVRPSLEYLVDRLKVPAVLGIESSSLVIANGQFMSDRGALLMSHLATAVAVTRFQQRPDGTTLVWRTSPSDRFQGKALADIVDRACVEPERVGVLFHDDPYGRGLADALSEGLCGTQQSGDSLACFRFAKQLPDTQQLGEGTERESEAERDARVKEASSLLIEEVLREINFIDVLAVFGFQSHATPIFKQLDEQLPDSRDDGSRADLTIVVGEAALSAVVLETDEVRRLSLPILGANPGLSRGRSFRRFDRAFRAAAQAIEDGPLASIGPAAFAAHAYDSVVALALAASTTPEGQLVTGDSLAAGLARLADVRADRFGIDQLLAASTALAASPSATINYEGASGDLDFEADVGEAPGTSIVPNLVTESGAVCAATDLGVHCSSADTPACRPDCSEPFPQVAAPDVGVVPLLLGGLLSMSGQSRGFGESRRRAMELALDGLNGPGVGRPVQMVLCDVETDVDLAVARGDEVIEERGVAAIVGPSSSAQAFAVGRRAAKAGVIMMTPSATAADVTTSAPPGPGGRRMVWRTAPSDADQSTRLARFVTEQTCIGRLELVYRDDVYGNGLRSGFIASACPGEGCPFEITPHVLPGDEAAEAFQALAETIANAEPLADALLLLPFQGEGLALLRALEVAGFDRPVIASETLITPGVAKEEGLGDLKLYGTSSGLARGPAWNDFALQYAARFDNGVPDVFAAASYDAVLMLGLAAATIDLADAPTGAGLSSGLARLTGGDTEFSPGQLRLAAATLAGDSTAAIEYVGASGDLDLDPKTGEAPADVPMFTITGGVLSPLELDAGEKLFCP